MAYVTEKSMGHASFSVGGSRYLQKADKYLSLRLSALLCPLLPSSSLSVTLGTMEEERCFFLGAAVNVWDILSADQVWFIPVLLLSTGGQSILKGQFWNQGERLAFPSLMD